MSVVTIPLHAPIWVQTSTISTFLLFLGSCTSWLANCDLLKETVMSFFKLGCVFGGYWVFSNIPSLKNRFSNYICCNIYFVFLCFCFEGGIPSFLLALRNLLKKCCFQIDLKPYNDISRILTQRICWLFFLTVASIGLSADLLSGFIGSYMYNKPGLLFISCLLILFSLLPE